MKKYKETDLIFSFRVLCSIVWMFLLGLLSLWDIDPQSYILFMLQCENTIQSLIYLFIYFSLV